MPGHHLQFSIAQELTDIPPFRKYGGYNAYSEGWALYAERLAWEMGFEKDPMDNLGRLRDEMFRAVRLVVDTGMHAKRWTARTGYRLHGRQDTGMAEAAVVTEIERYLVSPGQALAYKTGMLKILELRERAKSTIWAPSSTSASFTMKCSMPELCRSTCCTRGSPSGSPIRRRETLRSTNGRRHPCWSCVGCAALGWLA